MSNDPELGATDPHWLTEASRIAPSIRRRFTGLRVENLSGGPTAVSIAEALFQVVQTISSNSRVLIVLDGFASVDPTSLHALAILERRPRSFSLMFALIGEDPEQVGNVLLRFATNFHPINLDPLSSREVLSLAQQLLKEHHDRLTDATTELIKEWSGGVPLFVCSLVRDWYRRAEGSFVGRVLSGEPAPAFALPDTIKRILGARHQNLCPVNRLILECLAVASCPLAIEELAEISGADTQVVKKSALDLIALEDVDISGGLLSIRSAIHAVFLYNEMSTPRRRFLHGSIASVIAKRGGLHGLAPAVANYTKAAMHEAAYRTAISAAEMALEQGAPVEAQRIIQSIKEPERNRTECLLLRAQSLLSQGKHESTIRTLELRAKPSPEQLVRVELLRCEAHLRSPRANLAAATRSNNAALRLARGENDAALHYRALLQQAEIATARRDVPALKKVVELVGETHHESAGPVAAEIALTNGYCRLNAGSFAAAYRDFADALLLAEGSTKPNLELTALNGSAICTHAMGERSATLDSLAEAYRRAQLLGDHGKAANVASNTMATLLDYGEHKSASHWYRVTTQHLQAAEPDRTICPILLNVSDYHLLGDELTKAFEAVGKASDHAGGTAKESIAVLLAEADLLWATGDECMALERVDEADELAGWSESHDALLGTDAPTVLRLITLGDWKRSKKLLRICDILAAPIPLAGLIEALATLEWIGRQLGQQWRAQPSAYQMIAATGMWGVRRRLEQLRIAIAR